MTLDNSLAELENAQLVRRVLEEDLAFLFRHALTHETAYASMLLKRRREIHLQVARVYARLSEGEGVEWAPALARHYWKGGDWERAAEYSVRAGAAATKMYALREAVGYYEHALEAFDKVGNVPPEKIIDATLGWIEGAIRLRPYDELLHRLTGAERMARELNDKRRLARVLHWIADSHFAYGFNTRGMPALFENYQMATELGEERLTVVPSYYMAFFMVNRDPRAALVQLDQVIELARKFHNKDIEAHAISTKAFAHARLGEFEAARAEADESIRLARGLHSPIKDADIHNLVGFAYLDMGDAERALKLAEYGAEKALSVRGLECAAAGYMCVGMGNLRLQKLGAAKKAFEETIRLAEFTGGEHLRNFGKGGVALAQLLAGSETALTELEDAVTNAEGIEDPYTAALFAESLGELLTRTGDYQRASHYLESALDYYRRTEMVPYLVRTLASYAGLMEQEGRTAEAEEARSEVRALVGGPNREIGHFQL